MRFIFLSLLGFVSLIISAQAPALIPYQAIARNADGQPAANSAVTVRFSIHNETVNGEVIWQEEQSTTTGATGLMTLQLGSIASLANIDWAGGAKFLQIELNFGSGFIDMGTQQMLSVPYALHAGSVQLNVSLYGDTLFTGNGQFLIVPGVSYANNGGLQEITSVVIGGQEWMNRNLSVATYSDGTPIPQVTNFADWSALTTERGVGLQMIALPILQITDACTIGMQLQVFMMPSQLRTQLCARALRLKAGIYPMIRNGIK